MSLKHLYTVLIFSLVFTGCKIKPVPVQKYNVSFDNTQFEQYVSKVEEKFKMCFEDTESTGWADVRKTILREDFYNPRYSKLKLCFPTISQFKCNDIIYLVKNGNKIDLRFYTRGIKDIKLMFSGDVEDFVKNNMECK